MSEKAGNIYLRVEDGLVAMSEAPYDAEVILQKLLAEYPDLLAGDQMRPDAPRRWLLVSREVGIPDSENSTLRWSLDHLFVDQDAVPTLVEVKRSSDTRLRREVVGQMLDYAANLVSYRPPSEVRSLFEDRCRAEGLDHTQELARLLGIPVEVGGDEDPVEAFWQLVGENMATRRLRLVFVADVIPHELQSVVEFLNENLVRTDVLALEVKQFVGKGGQILVPRVIGQTATATDIKRPSARRQRKSWTPEEALRDIDATDHEMGRIARRIMEWAGAMPDVEYIVAGRVAEIKPGLRVGGRLPTLFAFSIEGKVYLGFATWSNSPILGEESERLRFLDELNTALGTEIARTTGWPAFPISAIADPTRFAHFIGVMTRLIERVQGAGDGLG